MRIIYSIIFILFSIVGFSQKEANIWYFGGQAGLNFNFNPPKPFLNGMLNHLEGNGSIADESGNLIYYSDGENIWDSAHQIIKNGSGLLGGKSSTQASIFIRSKKNDKYIYAITTSMKGDSSPMYYNVIYKDSIIIKNRKLLKYGSEKLNAVNHLNNNDVWIGTHSLMNDTFFFYLLKEKGLIDCPIIEVRNPSLVDIGENQGQIKFSSDGKFMSCNFIGLKKQTFIAQFDSEKGELNNSLILDDIVSYSSEFSPNSRYLYASEFSSSLYQYDLYQYDLKLIKNSRKTIISNNVKGSFALQIGSDKRIYLANPSGSYLKAIINPDSAGKKCQLKDSFVYLGGRKSSYGLPNFNQSYFYTPSIDYSYEQDCRTNTIAFEGKDTIKATSYKWIFSKGIKTDTKTAKDASYTFDDTGKWQVKYIVSNGTRTDTVTKTISIRPKLEKGFLGEINFCNVNPLPIILHAPKDLHCVHWYDSNMNELNKSDSLKVTKEGTYYCKATNLSFCVEWDTIKISKSIPKAGFNAIDVCESDSVVFINTSRNANSYIWKFGDGKTNNLKNPKHKYQITTSTTFNVTLIVKTDGCTDSITKPVTVNQNPSSDFSYSQTDNTFDLTAIKTGLSKYKWVFGTTDSIVKTSEKHTHIAKSKDQERICLTVTDLLGCTSQTCTTATIGIQSPLNANEIKIYPNPSKGKLTIEINKAGHYTLKVYNKIGELVLLKIINGNVIPTVSLREDKGIYLIEIVDNNGLRIYKKVVIE